MVLLVVRLAVLWPPETRVAPFLLRVKLDLARLAQLRLGQRLAAHGVHADELDPEAVPPQDRHERVERVPPRDVKVKQVAQGLLERVRGEAAQVPHEGEHLAQRERVRQLAVLKVLAEVPERRDERLEELGVELWRELLQDAQL